MRPPLSIAELLGRLEDGEEITTRSGGYSTGRALGFAQLDSAPARIIEIYVVPLAERAAQIYRVVLLGK